MKFDPNWKVMTISRRNAATLLAKLDDPDSERTIQKLIPEVGLVTLKIEDDAEHYGEEPAGVMHPDHDPGRTDGGPIAGSSAGPDGRPLGEQGTPGDPLWD